ncbi:hypothetical protein [Mesorhizobium sp. IMUNJ 23232]|uniref:hypothetical protein n=1 Tax=Mesorhizobium sp. IMUNJ 23232 TaxID=3376064 RepID=UPI0037905AAB
MQVIDLLLGAYFVERAADRMMEYVETRVVPRWNVSRAFQTLVFLKPTALTPAALVLREAGPSYLATISIGGVKERLRAFFRDHYHLISSERLHDQKFSESMAVKMSNSGKLDLAAALAVSEIFRPKGQLLVFPVTPMSVADDFISDAFFLIRPQALPDHLPTWLDLKKINSEQMPPFTGSPASKNDVGAWLGVEAAVEEAAKKTKRIVLGAIALAPIQRERWSFTLRSCVQNYCGFSDKAWTASSSPHTPPIGAKIVIRADDKPWLLELARIIDSPEKPDRHKRNALEYFFRAWFLDKVERCPVLFMALDAIYGQSGAGAATAKMKNGIVGTICNLNIEANIDSMMVLRNLVLHGAVPDVYLSSKYRDYYRTFDRDLMDDLEAITVKCLRKHIFGDLFTPQDDPYADLISKHEGLGTIPSMGLGPIVAEWP